MIKRIKVSELLLDYELYPRMQIDSNNVSQMVEALRAGIELPPIVVDKKSLRVSDGFHRVRAHQRVNGANAEISVVFKTYETDVDIFCDAVRLNAGHGRQLSPYDKARCIAKAEGYKLEPKAISSLLNMTIERYSQMKAERFALYQGEPIVLKRTLGHLAGRDLTDGEANYNAKAGGMNQAFYINQVVSMLEAKSVDWADKSVSNAMSRLKSLLKKIKV